MLIQSSTVIVNLGVTFQSKTMSFVGYIILVAVCLLSTSAYAACGCVCDDNNTAHSYIVELSGSGRECPLPSGQTGSRCYNFDCAKCGQVLECYVNTGSAAEDTEVCGVVKGDQFCSVEQGRDKFKTLCGQQCSGREGIECYEGESWAECPAVISSSVARCKAGASGNPAQLSNFASYRVCLGGGGSTCEATGRCSTDAVGGSSYSCSVSSGCTASDPVQCLRTKCDADSSLTSTCPCAKDL